MEVKETGVVAVVGLLVEVAQPTIDVLPVQQRLQLTIGLDSAVFCDAEEDEPVDSALDGKVQLVDSQRGIAECKILGERLRQVSISFRNSASTVAVPRLRSVTAYLSKEPLSTASLVKMEAISSHLAR